jgi:uncharacterized membrane protein
MNRWFARKFVIFILGWIYVFCLSLLIYYPMVIKAFFVSFALTAVHLAIIRRSEARNK